MVGYTDRIGPASTPAMPATPLPSAKTIELIRGAFVPMAWEISLFSAIDCTRMPRVVRLKATASAVMNTAVKAMTNSQYFG